MSSLILRRYALLTSLLLLSQGCIFAEGPTADTTPDMGIAPTPDRVADAVTVKIVVALTNKNKGRLFKG